MKTVLRLLPLVLSVLAWLLSGCSHTYPVTFGSDKVRGDTVTVGTFNRRLMDRDVTIIARDGREISASKVFLARDSCLFTDSTGRVFLPTADISTFRHVDHLSSTVGGLGLGFLGGFAVGMGVALVMPKDADSRMGSGIFAIGATVVGSIIGAIVGGVHGTVNDYPIPEATPDSSGRHIQESLPLDSKEGTPGSGANGS